MRIDLHVHTRERSHCAHSSTERMIQAAIESGLEGVVITDHDRLVPRERLSYLNAKYAPFRVFGGVEITTRSEHILVLGVDGDERDLRPRLEQTWWTYPELYAFVVERGGFLAVAHPFRFNRARIGVDVERFRPHALEVSSHNTRTSAVPRIVDVAANLDVPLLSNSDAHHVSDIGAYYNVLEGDPRDARELASALKQGAFQPMSPECGQSGGSWPRRASGRSGFSSIRDVREQR